MSDADLLRRAEAKVREVVAATNWPTGDTHNLWVDEWRTSGMDDAEHIALWSPPVALAVAELLGQHALLHDSYDCLHDPCAALALARRILGEES